MNTNSQYTLDEIFQMMDRAAECGITVLGLPGFKSPLTVKRPAGSNHRPAATPRPTAGGNTAGRRLPAHDLSHRIRRPSPGPGDFITKFGIYRGRALKQIPLEELESYGKWLMFGTQWESLSPQAQEWIDKAEEYLRRA